MDQLSYRDCLLQNLSNDKESPSIEPLSQISKRTNNTYFKLNQEVNLIRALSSFKNNLVEHIIRYFRAHQFYNQAKLKYIRIQMYNHFPNWFFNLNLKGQLKGFIPQAPLEIQDNLDYLFKEHQIEKKSDFDQKLLTFNLKYLKHDLIVNQIKITEQNRQFLYSLETNNGEWILLPITKQQHHRLKTRYLNKEEFDQHLAIMLLRYKFLGGLNNHLSVPPVIYSHLKVDLELYGTPFNVMVPDYCSPFPEDLEEHFGSRGSVINYRLKDNQVYAANPPYDVQVIQQLAEKLAEELTELNNTTVYLIIPLWKDDFPAHDLLLKNSYLKDNCELNRDEYPFYHYFKERLIPAVNTYLLVFSTGEQYYTCDQIKKMWPR